MKKKMALLTMAAVLALSVTACGSSDSGSSSDDSSSSSSSEQRQTAGMVQPSAI